MNAKDKLGNDQIKHVYNVCLMYMLPRYSVGIVSIQVQFYRIHLRYLFCSCERIKERDAAAF